MQDNELNRIKVNVFQYLFAEEARLQNELENAQQNFKGSSDALDLYELIRAQHREELFDEVYHEIARLINS